VNLRKISVAEQQPKLLIQSYKFPPIQVVGAQRIYQLHRHLEPYFARIYGITTANRQFFPQDEGLHLPQAWVKEVPTSDLRTWLARRGGIGAYLSAADQRRFNWPRLRHLYYSFPFVFWSGDGGCGYIRNSVRAASALVEQQGVTHVLSSYRPWADHIVAYRLKKRYPHLVWIADFRDLAIDPVRRDVWWPGLQRYYQRRLLRRADVVTTVSEGLAKRLRPDCREVLVVRNGLDQLPASFLSAPLSRHFTITYTGSLYPGLQTAAPLLRLLRSLLDENEINPAHLRLHYAGKDEELWMKWLRAHDLAFCSVSHGMLPLAAAQDLQRQSQLNLLLSWSAKDYGGIMTAKLASYLQAGRPILALLNGPSDPELVAGIETTGGGRVFPTVVPQMEAALRTFVLDSYRVWQFSGALPWQVSAAKLQAYTWEQQLRPLLSGMGLQSKQARAML
jgi:hypothetical protein